MAAKKLEIGRGVSPSVLFVLVASLLALVAAHSPAPVFAATPTISSVSITSDPGDDDTYGHRDSIVVTVAFTKTVEFDGFMELKVDIGDETRTISRFIRPGEASSPSTEIPFLYFVQLGDSDSDGISIPANALRLLDDGEYIRDSDGHDADLTHDTVDDDPDHKVSSYGGL